MRFILVSIDNDLTESVLAVIGKDNAIRFPTVPRMCSAGFGGDGIIITGVSGPGRVNAATRLGCRNMIAVYPSRGKRMPPVRKENGVVYLGAPFTKEDLSIAVAETDSCFSVAAAIRKQLAGSSAIMEKTRQLVEKAIYSNLPVHLIGETGTGKTAAAGLIHRFSGSRKEIVSESCGCLSSGIADSELFGHSKGAFSGAAEDRTGLLEAADGSTLFLDELQDLTLELQSKLMRVLDTGEYRKLGSNIMRHTSFRLITASNEPLEELMRTKRIRKDFFYRISSIVIRMPSLSEHMEDIPEIIATRAGYDAFCDYTPFMHDFPGNVRQLFSECELIRQGFVH